MDINFRLIKSLFFTGAIVMAALSSGACSEDEDDWGSKITHEVNSNVDFSTFKTFKVINPLDENLGEEPPEELVKVMDDLIAEINSQMTALGLKEQDDNPDLSVSPFVKGDQNTTPVTFYDYFYGYYWGYEYTWTVDVEYATGTLVIDVVDAGASDSLTDDELVFRGTVSGIMGQDIDVIQLQLRNSVNAIFEGWPAE